MIILYVLRTVHTWSGVSGRGSGSVAEASEYMYMHIRTGDRMRDSAADKEKR